MLREFNRKRFISHSGDSESYGQLVWALMKEQGSSDNTDVQTWGQALQRVKVREDAHIVMLLGYDTGHVRLSNMVGTPVWLALEGLHC